MERNYSDFAPNPLEKILFKRLLKKTRKIHVLSSFNKIALLRLVPELEDRVLLFPGAPARRLMGKGPKKPKSKEEKIKILCVGRIHLERAKTECWLPFRTFPVSWRAKSNACSSGL